MARTMDAAFWYGYRGSTSYERRTDDSKLANGEKHGILLCGYICKLGGVWICAGIRFMDCCMPLYCTILLWWTSYV